MPPPFRSRTQTTTTAASDEPANSVLLERILNFLGDEDIHRNYDFLPHMNRIDEYLQQLFLDHIGPRATKPIDFNVNVWEQASLMVKTHKEWIAKDETVKPIDFAVVAALLQERAQILKSDLIRPATGMQIIPAPILPTNPAIPKEVPLRLALPPNDPNRNKLTDPLHYTKKAAQHRRLKEYAATHAENETITSHIPTRANFHGPHIKEVSKEEVAKAKADRIARIDTLVAKLKATQVEVPRLLLKKVILRIREGSRRRDFTSNLISDNNVEDFKQWTASTEALSPLTTEEFKLLSILTESSWDSMGRSSHNTRVKKDKHPEDRFHVAEIPNLGITKTVRYNGDGEVGPQITMDSWAVFQRLGYRLGVERAHLSRKLTDKEEHAGEEAREAKLQDLIETQFPDLSLDEIIKPLLPPRQTTTTWTPSQKASVLRNQIIHESLVAESPRTLDHTKLWQFAETKDESPHPFFSVSRWPIELMAVERRREMAEMAPLRDRKIEQVQLTPEEMAVLEKETVDAYFAPPPRERFTRGLPHYPFGETRVQEAVLSNQIANDLEGVEGYDFRPDMKLGFWSRLNPVNWWGKRRAENDANEDSGKRREVDDFDDSEGPDSEM